MMRYRPGTVRQYLHASLSRRPVRTILPDKRKQRPLPKVQVLQVSGGGRERPSAREGHTHSATRRLGPHCIFCVSKAR